MSKVDIPVRGAPPVPHDWGSVHDGPAVEEGAVPGYLLDRGPGEHVPAQPLEVVRNSGRDRVEVCDVVIVGSGAGGATLAKELSDRGLSVIVVEEGDLFTSRDFAGPPSERFMRMCRSAGSTSTLGKVSIPIPIGRTVGGTTTVNSGTCFRAPRRVLEKWVNVAGDDTLSYDALDPSFRQAEEIVGVRPVPWDILGPTGWLTHYGARAIGATGGPILRNIRACHGSGQCVFGCPTDAKQAMHLSYLPEAQRQGARIYARTKVEWITIQRGRASGITARFLDENERPAGTLVVKAKAVAVACGAIGTPLLLLKNRLANGSRQIGRNLSIHPATGVAGWFEDAIYGWRGTLQPYYVDSLFQTHGVMVEATNSVPSVGSSVFPGYGLFTKEVLANYAHLATVGFLVADTSKGRVRRGPGDEPLITYQLNQTDTRNLYAGLALSAEILLGAGAISVTSGIGGLEPVIDSEGVEKIRTWPGGPKDLKLSAFHPVGTARIGRDPQTSVVDSRLESHEVPGLYVTDASVFPSCAGVNPQMTIMALATRAAEHLATHV